MIHFKIGRINIIVKFAGLILAVFFTSFGLTQDKDKTPMSLIVDPYDYLLKKLAVEQIIQYKIYKDTNELISREIEKKNLVYVVNYDSIGRLRSFKYDFRLHTGSDYTLLQSKSIKISAKVDSSKLFIFKLKDTLEVYNFYEKSYFYDLNGIQKILMFNPVYYRGFTDGVFVKETLPVKECKINLFNSNNELIKTENYINDKLISTLEYLYQEYSNNNYKARLLFKTIYTRNSHITETHLEYTFK